MTNKDTLIYIDDIFSEEKKKSSLCMFHDCSNESISSHVFSRSHILKPISKDLNIYQFNQRPLIFLSNKHDVFCYKLEPIRNAFIFKGFCQKHDNDLFKSIEPHNGFVDWSQKKSQYLLSYRTICREIYANNVVINVIDTISKNNYAKLQSVNLFSLEKQLITLQYTRENLFYYKSLLEKDILKKDFSSISFKYIELPFQFDLCVSAPIYIDYGNGLCFNSDCQELNIINIFPYYGKTIILFGYLQKFNNQWMNGILPKFKSPYPHIVSSAFVDILYRAEFNAMSPSLYDSLDKDLLNEFFRTWKIEVNNFSDDMQEVSHLFYYTLNELMPKSWKDL